MCDEMREFPNGHIQVVHVGQSESGQFVLWPGWRWSNDVKPIVQTEWCEAPHFGYQLKGTLHVEMKDGSELEVHEGDVTVLPLSTMPGSLEIKTLSSSTGPEQPPAPRRANPESREPRDS